MEAFSEALTLLQNQKFSEAEVAFREIVKSGSKDTQAYQHLAECQLHQQKLIDARYTLEEGLSIDPNKAELLTYLSQILWGMGQKSKAIEHYERVAACNPPNVEVLTNLGSMYYEVGRKDDAIQAFHDILGIAPQMYQAYFNIGFFLTEQAKYDEAIINLKEGLKIAPNDVFGNRQLGMALHISGDILEAIRHYDISLTHATTDMEKMEVLLLTANAYRDLKEYEKANEFYEQVLTIDPENEMAKSNIKYVAKRNIPGWHFNMLADTSRNEAYDKAITAAVKDGDHVLDIGAGSGLLSLMAARAGAAKVTAAEMVPEMAEVATMVIADNNYDNVITVHQQLSSSLRVGEEMTEKANVVVSEILDAGLLGEGVLPSLRHAWANLLTEDAVCIPKAADIQLVLIQCDDYHMVNPVREIQGFDLSAFNHFRADNEYIVKHSSQFKSEQLSSVVSAMTVDFYNLPKQTLADNPNKHFLEIDIEKDGRLHGVMFWFTLHIDDSIRMSSGPDGELIHWGQAIYMFEEEQEVKVGEKVQVNLLQTEALITFEKV